MLGTSSLVPAVNPLPTNQVHHATIYRKTNNNKKKKHLAYHVTIPLASESANQSALPTHTPLLAPPPSRPLHAHTHEVESSSFRLFPAPPHPPQRWTNAAARCALIGQAPSGSARRLRARLLRAGARQGRRLLAASLEGVEARRRHAQPQGQPQCLLFLRTGEDSRTASARPAGGPRGRRHPLLLGRLGGEAAGSWAAGRVCWEPGLRGARGGDTTQRPDQPTEPSRTGGRGAWNGRLTACLSCLPLLSKLLREDEKEKYSEMAREWRAAQGKDSGPSEKQVRAAWTPAAVEPEEPSGSFQRVQKSQGEGGFGGQGLH